MVLNSMNFILSTTMPVAVSHKPFGQELEAQLADLEAAEDAVRVPNCLKTRRLWL
jgi:hypothetical protein